MRHFTTLCDCTMLLNWL